MTLWLPQSGQIYLPPAKPVAKVLSTDEYVVGTNLFFYASSERLLTVGHPYFEIPNPALEGALNVPKVSGSQYRVFRCLLPDPNKFALIEKSVYNPERERLVWKIKGLQLGRGGPLGIGTSGHPLFNKVADTENPNKYPTAETDEQRQNVSMEPKQVQMLIVGCEPAMGEHWDVAKPCNGEVNPGDCPPIQLLNTVIEDGDMCDTGFGAANFKTLQQDKSGVPLDIVDSICKWPDLIKMEQDVYGDKLFFFTKKEQLYARHYFARAGVNGDALPDGTQEGQDIVYLNPDRSGNAPQKTLGSYTYFPTVSGSLVTSEAQLFNRPYFIQKAQGSNNAVCWNNNLFLTVVDNSRNVNFTISVYNTAANVPAPANQYNYKASDFKQYLRHVEEYDVELVFQLCKVSLDPDVLAHINVMDPTILENWQLSFVPPPPQSIEDTYRYIRSTATRCPTEDEPAENKDPYKNYNFWTVDLKERFSAELSQFPLGRKFLFQTGLLKSYNRSAVSPSLKRVRSTSISGTTARAKRRRVR